MLKNILLRNFKCFEMLSMPCAPLTLLCGLNGMGKSSVFQSLLVLRQSIDQSTNGVFPDELILGGAHADLGTGVDVLYEDAQSSTIGIEIQHQEIPKPYSMSFDYSPTDDRLIASTETESNFQDFQDEWATIPPIGGDLFYVNAERIGPRKLYQLSETNARRARIGIRSEYALSYWNYRKRFRLSEDDPRRTKKRTRTLSAILNDWLKSISPGANLVLDSIPNADSILVQYSFDRLGDIETRPFRATNVGFGLSYTLPVMISLLTPPGTMCLIENPEAHLHPQGQTKLAELAVLASKAGVQILVETHSDHFLDGVRIAVRNGQIPPEQVAIHYFERVEGKSTISSPEIDSDGRLSFWPTGFFDQRDKNLVQLLVPRT